MFAPGLGIISSDAWFQTFKKMLLRVGGKTYTPVDLLAQYFNGLSSELRQHPLLSEATSRLKANQPQLERSNYEVCHGDLNHKTGTLI